jgi:hypothetical protein
MFQQGMLARAIVVMLAGCQGIGEQHRAGAFEATPASAPNPIAAPQKPPALAACALCLPAVPADPSINCP